VGLLKRCSLGFYGDFLNFFEKVFLKGDKRGVGIQSDCRGGASKKRKRPFIPGERKGEEKGREGEEETGAARSCESDDFERGAESVEEKKEKFLAHWRNCNRNGAT
jgi:hypothetical protein